MTDPPVLGKRAREPLPLPAPKRTRSATDAARRAAAARELEIAQRAAAELARRRQEGLDNLPVAPAGNRGDGNLHIVFIQMGQGDCSIITTPQGRVIMIDCGSDATERSGDEENYIREIKDTIYGPKFLRGSNDLDFLILTHPDSDHYNKLTQVLEDTISLHNVYHSALITNYAVAQTSAWIKNHVADERFNIKAITVNAEAKTINGAPVLPAGGGDTIDRIDDTGGVRIVDEPNCTVTILCSNVNTNTIQDGSTWQNRGSVVTLIRAFGQSILICGDATKNTEKFLVDTYPGFIGRLSLLQIPHHGSNLTSSSLAFSGLTDPTLAVISAGKMVFKDHLPSQVVVNRYSASMPDNVVPDHELFYWVPGALNSFFHDSSFTKKNLFITGSNFTIVRLFGAGA